MPTTETVSIPRDTPECRAGTAAFNAGQSVDDCPYPIGNNRRVGWMTGWLDARTNSRLGHIFEKHGMTHP